MQSMTLSSDRALMRADWRRFWPLFFGYAAVWLCALPLGLWSQRSCAYYDTDRYSALENVSDYLGGCTAASTIVSAFFGVLLAMALFAYLMNSRSVGLMHSLPVTRGRQFYAHFFVGVQIFTLVHVAVGAIALLVQAGLGAVYLRGTLEWMAVAELSCLFFFALATLCAMVTGWLLAVPVIYAGVNFLFAAFYLLFSTMADMFYWGMGGTDWPAWLDWLTPSVRMFSIVSDYREVALDDRHFVSRLSSDAWTTLLIYTAAAVVLVAAAYLFYRLRHSETAGDAIVFGWLRPVVLYVISLAGGIGLGLLLWFLIDYDYENNSIIALLLCQIFAGLIVYFGVQMLLHKSFKVFNRRGWLGAALLAVLLIAAGLAVRFDLFGVARYVPRADKVGSASIENYETFRYADGLTRPETIEKLTAVHEAILAQGEPTAAEIEDAVKRAETHPDQVAYMTLSLKYTLTNGTYVRRWYSVVVERDTPLYKALNDLYNDPQVRSSSTRYIYGDGEIDSSRIVSCFFNNWQSDKESVTLSRAQACQLYEALQKYAARKAQESGDILQKANGTQRRTCFYLEFTSTPDPNADNGYVNERAYGVDDLPADCTEVLDLLVSFGLAESAEELIYS